MDMPDFRDPTYRKSVIAEINQEENHSRKREHQKRFDVYNERQDRYILERLRREFNFDTVQQMRKILSVNMTRRIIDELSSVYKTEPDRNFYRSSGQDLTDTDFEQIEALYKYTMINNELKNANKYLNLNDQCALMIVPNKMGEIKVKAITPVHYDVVPHPEDSTKAYAYILNVWDYDLHRTARDTNLEPTQLDRYRLNDRMNQTIADDNDRMAEQDRYIIWTDELHMTVDGTGQLVKGTEIIENPIGRLPFVDVSRDKDFQFFVRRGTSVVDFALDLGLVLSDTANTVRLQSYAQAVMKSEKPPQNLTVGPNNILWLPINPDAQGGQTQADFDFVSPSPDISGSLEFIDVMVNLFLSSRGIDPMTVSGKGEARTFSSGMDRLLAMLDKFQATKDDYALFSNVEDDAFKLLRDWSNAMQSVVGEGELKPELKRGVISDDTCVDVKFNEPTDVQTQAEKEDSVMKLMEQGLMSRVEAVMKLRGVSEDAAREIIRDIDSDMTPTVIDGEI